MTKRGCGERPTAVTGGRPKTDGGSAVPKVPDPRWLPVILQLIRTLASGMAQNAGIEEYSRSSYKPYPFQST